MIHGGVSVKWFRDGRHVSQVTFLSRDYVYFDNTVCVCVRTLILVVIKSVYITVALLLALINFFSLVCGIMNM